MNTLTLLAVDEPQTASREDGFLLESFDNGSMKKLIVATVIPPIDAHINYGAFLRNLHLENGEPNEQFLRKGDRVKFGLGQEVEKKVLMAIFEFDEDDNFIISASTGLAVIEECTYEEFSSRLDFEYIKRGIEEFLFQNCHAEWKYRTGQGEQYWSTEVTPARRLIAALLGMFNRAISKYAYAERLRTFKRTQEGFKFKVHDEARFRGPLRKAASFINILNIVAAIEETPLPFPSERLQKILGEGYPIQI